MRLLCVVEKACGRKLRHVAELWKLELEIVLVVVPRVLTLLGAGFQTVGAADPIIAANPRESLSVLFELDLKTFDLGPEEAVLMVGGLRYFLQVFDLGLKIM